MIGLVRSLIALFLSLSCIEVLSFKLKKVSPVSYQQFQKYSSLGGQRFESLQDIEVKVIGPYIFNHLGDEPQRNIPDEFDRKKKASFNLNVGRAQEVLRRELPFIFALSNIDFSIFAPYITVADGSGNKMVMPKNLYSTAVKSLQMAASFSSIYPSMNVRKIEYIEDSATIQCLVDVVLPDSVRVEGQAVWEGMFYFGLDENGLINSHVFDRKISNMRPTPITVSQFAWLKPRPMWSSDLLTGVAASTPTTCSEVEDMVTSSYDNIPMETSHH